MKKLIQKALINGLAQKGHFETYALKQKLNGNLNIKRKEILILRKRKS